jgi:L-arabonate dehydrase
MVKEDLKPSDVLTKKAFENAITVNAAIGGSTNFIIHLLAIAGRIRVELNMDDFNTIDKGVPLLANLQPSGKYFMEDFFYAGGLPALMKELQPLLHNEVITVTGKPMSDNYCDCECFNRNVIGTLEQPFNQTAGIVVVKGNLCENGAVLKPSAATPALLQHTGKAVVFENIEDYKQKIDDPDLDVEEGDVLVLKHVGPRGYPGMPEVGNMSIPKKLLNRGVRDMVRISDGRMSGTGFGTTVLHVSPEAAIGGTLGIVRNGDVITLDLKNKTLTLEVSEIEIAERKSKMMLQDHVVQRGYTHMYQMHVEQAHLGADLDFLKGSSGSDVVKDSH